MLRGCVTPERLSREYGEIDRGATRGVSSQWSEPYHWEPSEVLLDDTRTASADGANLGSNSASIADRFVLNCQLPPLIFPESQRKSAYLFLFMN
jgi:hypothetical protein